MDSRSPGTVGSGQDANPNHISTCTFDTNFYETARSVPKNDCRSMMKGSIVITEKYMLSYNRRRSQRNNPHPVYGFHSIHYCISFSRQR